MRFPFGGHFVDAIHAKGAFQLSFCRYFRQKLFVLNLYVSMIDIQITFFRLEHIAKAKTLSPTVLAPRKNCHLTSPL